MGLENITYRSCENSFTEASSQVTTPKQFTYLYKEIPLASASCFWFQALVFVGCKGGMPPQFRGCGTFPLHVDLIQAYQIKFRVWVLPKDRKTLDSMKVHKGPVMDTSDQYIFPLYPRVLAGPKVYSTVMGQHMFSQKIDPKSSKCYVDVLFPVSY